MAQRKSGGFVELVKTFVYAGLIALVIRTFLFEPFSIPSGSMIPTLLVGDYLFVSKYAYGYSRHSLPFSPPLFSGRVFESQPERGDVVVFKLPSDAKTDYIKRVIGLPGDRVQVKQGILHLNGEPVRRELLGPYPEDDGAPRATRYRQYLEILPTGRSYRIIEESDSNQSLFSGLPDSSREYVVPDGHFFAMGDNRDNSKDSRYSDVGPVPFENIVGRAEVIFFSLDGRILEVWRWPETVRIGRMFQSID